MSKPKWRPGAAGCWWAIVPRKRDAMYPLPWLMGSTRSGAWRSWHEHYGGNDFVRAVDWKCIRVHITQVTP